LNNGIVSVSFEGDGKFSIHDAKSRNALLTDARFWLPRGKLGQVVEMYARVLLLLLYGLLTCATLVRGAKQSTDPSFSAK
jgi:hypothetical protein